MNTALNTKYIDIQNVEQTFKTKKGLFPALRDIHLTAATQGVANRPCST
jgi:nitrate/nitrite transport system ATP-binding protein